MSQILTITDKIQFDVSPVFYANYNVKEDVVINQGGTDSGKTYAIMQLLFIVAVTQEAPKDNPIITIVAESVPNLKKGAYRVAKNILSANSWIQDFIQSWNETDRTIYFKSGWLMEFMSYENEQQAKQGKRQYLFVNEAQSLAWLIFWQLAKRTRIRTFIDYNPTAPFWSHDNLIGTTPETNELSATVKLIISDHRHNPFLSEADHRKTEGIKDRQLWLVYARGKTGNVTGLIFPDWQRIPDEQFHRLFIDDDGKPTGQQFFGGLDFGYTNDPTAGVKIARIGESLFIHEICYTPGITPTNIKQLFYANGFTSDNIIYCEHDPNMIQQMRLLDMCAMAAIKGPGSINAGIQKLKEYKVFYTASSVNIHNERMRYIWVNDKNTGKPTNVPIDSFNHLMDAIRYGVYSNFYTG